MLDKGKKSVLGILVDAIDYDAAVARILTAARARRAMTVSALAVHGVMTGVLDSTHRYRLNHFDLLVPDGQPVCWALNLLHHSRLVDRVYGPNLMLRICERASEEGLPIYLYGSRGPVIEALAANLQTRFPKLIIAGYQPSKFRQLTSEEMDHVARQIRESGAAMTFVGLGCPRQEIWAYENALSLSMPAVAVGAAFDFHAGLLPQAPLQMQRFGLEWLFRLLQEPQRLWRRYVLLNPLYIALLILQASGFKQFDPSHATAPAAEVRYG